MIYRLEEASKDTEFTSTYLTAVEDLDKQQYSEQVTDVTIELLCSCATGADISIEKTHFDLSGYSLNTGY